MHCSSSPPPQRRYVEHDPMAEQTMSVGANLAVALQRNRELTIELYTMRNESPPDDSGCGHSPSTQGVLLASLDTPLPSHAPLAKP